MRLEPKLKTSIFHLQVIGFTVWQAANIELTLVVTQANPEAKVI